MFLRRIREWLSRPSPERQVLEGLRTHWAHDGLPARVEGNLVYLGVEDLAARVEVPEIKQVGGRFSAVLWIRLSPAESRAWEIGDVATGLGSSRKEALTRAATTWLHRVPPSVLLGLYGRDLYQDCDVSSPDDEWGLPGCTVYSSQYQVLSLREQEIPEAFLDRGMWHAVRDVFREHFPLDTVHWLKLFCSINGWNCMADCFVDNRNWDPGRDQIVLLELPEVEGPMMLWQFVLVVPNGQPRAFPASTGLRAFGEYDFRAEPAPGLPTLRDKVLLTIQTFREHPSLETDEITDVLVGRNIDRRQAEMLVALVPVAYGRTVLQRAKVSFTDRFVLVNSETHEERRSRLSAEPVFKIAMLFAHDEITSRGVGRDAMLAVAGRSPELDAINQALHAGSRLEDMVSGDLMVLVSFDLEPRSEGDAAT
ncbi:MAG TPA: DUF6348 family protein [Thermoguttaceae bacterium]|nr:DUF6348 family protein [Thermoguttaceae bacterium]